MTILDLTDVKANEIPDPEPVPADEEYELRIIAVNSGKTKKDDIPYFSPVFEVVGEPNCPEFNKFFFVPTKNKMDQKKFNRSVIALRNFGKAIDVDFFANEIDVDHDLIGASCFAILGIEENEEYGNKNYVKSFVISN